MGVEGMSGAATAAMGRKINRALRLTILARKPRTMAALALDSSPTSAFKRDCPGVAVDGRILPETGHRISAKRPGVGGPTDLVTFRQMKSHRTPLHCQPWSTRQQPRRR